MRSAVTSRSIPSTVEGWSIDVVPTFGIVDTLAVRVVGAGTVRLAIEGIFIGVTHTISTARRSAAAKGTDGNGCDSGGVSRCSDRVDRN